MGHPGSTGLGDAWPALEPGFLRCLELGLVSLSRRGLGVGSVVTDADGLVLGEGRNRAHDPPGGEGALQGTALAHAELNALAEIATAHDLSDCVLWSSQQPCSMCRAAIEFTGVGDVRYVAADPVDAGKRPVESEPADEWIVTANLLYLHNLVLQRGAGAALVLPYRELEPETADLAIGVVGERTILDRAGGEATLEAVLAALRARIFEAAARRRARLRRDRARPAPLDG